MLAGGSGNDTLDGHGGVDDYFGQAGNDTIEALDGNAERMSCGADSDLVRNDFIDIIAECEGAKDGDGDGSPPTSTATTRTRRSSPARARRSRTAIDEDCDGRDNIVLDRDADGFPVPADCNDANAAIRPGALEVKGNTVDENCDSRAEPFSLLRALVLNNWRSTAGARSCGCCRCATRRGARGSCSAARGELSVAARADEDRAARPGADPAGQPPPAARDAASRGEADGPDHRAETTGRTFTYTVKNGELPTWTVACRSPNESRSRAC